LAAAAAAAAAAASGTTTATPVPELEQRPSGRTAGSRPAAT
ncbi:EAL domain-containing protein, partial [Streptomyces sp. SID9124]|nr:EAL domain-containing protein [Streptomyces sp. SID9124]